MGPDIHLITDSVLDQLAGHHYDHGVERDGRTFKWGALSETLRERYREQMRSTLELIGVDVA